MEVYLAKLGGESSVCSSSAPHDESSDQQPLAIRRFAAANGSNQHTSTCVNDGKVWACNQAILCALLYRKREGESGDMK